MKRSEDLDYERADCGIAVQLTDMTAYIHHNTISNFCLAGIGIDGNRAPVRLENNEIAFCGYGSQIPQSGGIGVKRSAGVKVSVKENEITCGPVAGPGTTVLTSRNGIALWGASEVDVSSNTVTGTVSSDGILVTNFAPGAPNEQHSTDNSITHNHLDGLIAGHAQEQFDAGCDGNRSTNNDFGAVDLTGSGVAGIVVHSNDNSLTNETFHGQYPGVSGVPKVPCVWLTPGTVDNQVQALKSADGPAAFDLCSQVQDDGLSNKIPGYQRCRSSRTIRRPRPSAATRRRSCCPRRT